jgi:hypothetical protein
MVVKTAKASPYYMQKMTEEKEHMLHIEILPQIDDFPKHIDGTKPHQHTI